MSRTITAMFDNRTEAEEAADRLRKSRIQADRINVIDQSSQGYSSDRYSDTQDRGFWATLKDVFLPDEDRHAYEEGVRRGGVLVTAQVDEIEADEAIRVLEESNSVDFDQRQDEWRGSGWAGTSTGSSATKGFGSSATPGFAAGSSGTTGYDATAATGSLSGSRTSNEVVGEERIPIVEEELRVGKREVARGGARVRSYVVEQPVHEQVTLREEHVSVERRPVNETLRSGETGDLLRDREIEMTETSEEAVVAKEAVVREELVVHKTAEERVEDINETVRHTEVDIDDDLHRASASDRPGLSGLHTQRDTDLTDADRDFQRTDRDRSI
jgi:uncharacterized protein (TIGR02271 family)